nr:hypothetical protein [Pseudomonadota bacterium]
MFFLIHHNKIINSAESSSLLQFKTEYPIPNGSIASDYEYIEIPTNIFHGLTGYVSSDGTTGTMGETGTGVDISGITYSESFIRGDREERMRVLGVDMTNPLLLNDGVFAFSDDAVDVATIEFEIQDDKDLTSISLDPRLSSNITLTDLQTIKELESENNFLNEGLGTTASISFEKDDGSSQVLVFDSRRDTIIDLLTIKQYSDLNLSIVDTGDQTSVSVTGLQIIDTSGTVTSLSPTEFDKCLYALLSSFYENYLGRTDMKNIIQNPVG